MSKSVIFLSVHIPMYDDCMTKLVKTTNSLFARKNQTNATVRSSQSSHSTISGVQKELNFRIFEESQILYRI